MSDTTVKKVNSATAPRGEMGQLYLTSGKRVSMRLWRDEQPGEDKPATRREYETVGYVISGRAELTVEGQTLRLEPGDAWLVPAGAEHAQGRRMRSSGSRRRSSEGQSPIALGDDEASWPTSSTYVRAAFPPFLRSRHPAH